MKEEWGRRWGMELGWRLEPERRRKLPVGRGLGIASPLMNSFYFLEENFNFDMQREVWERMNWEGEAEDYI